MPLTIIADAGSASANSFGTLAEADAYFEARVGGAPWAGWTDADKNIALVTAGAKMNQPTYRGSRVSAEQSMEWPRANVYRGGLALPTDANPTFVKYAQFEEAFAILAKFKEDAEDPLAASGTENLKSLTAGPVSLTFKDDPSDGSKSADDPANWLSPQAYRFLKDYFLPSLSQRADGVRNFRMSR